MLQAFREILLGLRSEFNTDTKKDFISSIVSVYVFGVAWFVFILGGEEREKKKDIRNVIFTFCIFKILSVLSIKDFPEIYIKYYKTLT